MIFDMESTSETRVQLRRAGFFAGAVMLAGSLIGVIGQIYGMIHSYQTIEEKAAPTPADLAVGVRISLESWIFAAVVAAIGAMLLLRALSKLNRLDKQERERKGAGREELPA